MRRESEFIFKSIPLRKTAKELGLTNEEVEAVFELTDPLFAKEEPWDIIIKTRLLPLSDRQREFAQVLAGFVFGFIYHAVLRGESEKRSQRWPWGRKK